MFGDYDPSEGGTRVCPRLPSRNLAATAAFFERIGFGASLLAEGGGYLIVRAGWVELHFRPEPGMDPLRTAESCYVRMTDIDELSAHLQTLVSAEGYPRFQRPADRAWGMREAYLFDPDNNLVILGAPIADRVR